MSAKHVVLRPNHGIDALLRWIGGAGGPSANYLRQSRWQDHGACAEQVCAHCPVRRDCLALAQLVGEQHGVWGGLDRHQRQALTQTLRLGATLGSALDQGFGVQSIWMDAA